MDMEGAIAIFTTMRVIEMTMVMDMTTMIDIWRVIALIFTTKEAGMQQQQEYQSEQSKRMTKKIPQERNVRMMNNILLMRLGL